MSRGKSEYTTVALDILHWLKSQNNKTLSIEEIRVREHKSPTITNAAINHLITHKMAKIENHKLVYIPKDA